MRNIIIREAARQDAPAMMALIRELAAFERAAGQVTVDFNHFVESGFGPHPVWWAYVAEVSAPEEERTIAGFALYYIRYSTWKGQRMFLEDLVVSAPWRGQGIGTLLMEQLVKTARERNFSGMMWQVLSWNERAIAFYKQQGAAFDDSWINVSLDWTSPAQQEL